MQRGHSKLRQRSTEAAHTLRQMHLALASADSFSVPRAHASSEFLITMRLNWRGSLSCTYILV